MRQQLQSLGRYRRYQILAYLLLVLVYFRGAWHVFSIMFIGKWSVRQQLQSLGRYRRYQILAYLLLVLVYFRGAWHVFSIMFIGKW